VAQAEYPLLKNRSSPLPKFNQRAVAPVA